MVLYCKECAEKHRFYRDNTLEITVDEREWVDKDEETQDYEREDEDTNDTNYGDYKCGDCDSDVDEMTPEEIFEYDEEYAIELDESLGQATTLKGMVEET